jgi:hypothetical protein
LMVVATASAASSIRWGIIDISDSVTGCNRFSCSPVFRRHMMAVLPAVEARAKAA